MLESLNFHFSFYDWLLIFMVTALGTLSAYLKDPQLKAVTATIPADALPVGAETVRVTPLDCWGNRGKALVAALDGKTVCARRD